MNKPILEQEISENFVRASSLDRVVIKKGFNVEVVVLDSNSDTYLR